MKQEQPLDACSGSVSSPQQPLLLEIASLTLFFFPLCAIISIYFMNNRGARVWLFHLSALSLLSLVTDGVTLLVDLHSHFQCMVFSSKNFSLTRFLKTFSLIYIKKESFTFMTYTHFSVVYGHIF